MFSCEFCEISKNTLSDRTPLLAASKFVGSFQKFPELDLLFQKQWARNLRKNMIFAVTIVIKYITRFFISNTFISKARLKSTKNQANAKQHPDAEPLLFENYSHSSSTLSSINNRTYSKKVSDVNKCLIFAD